MPRKTRCEYERGFLRPVLDLTAADFLAIPAETLAAVPLWSLKLRSRGIAKLFEAVLASPNFERVGSLTFSGPCRYLDALAAARPARNLRAVNFSRNNTTKEWLAPRDGPGVASLQELEWSGTLTGPEFAAFAASAFAPATTRLSLSWCTTLGVEGAAQLASPDRFPRLRKVLFDWCGLTPTQLEILLNASWAADAYFGLGTPCGYKDMGDAELAVLLKSKWAEGQTSLDLPIGAVYEAGKISDAGAEMLSRWPGLANLTGSLALINHRIGTAGAIALANALPAELRHLRLVGNPLNESAEAVESLRTRFCGGTTRVTLSRTSVTEAVDHEEWVEVLPPRGWPTT
jgi:hypothetical protein